MTLLKRLLAATLALALSTPAYAAISSYSTTASSNVNVDGTSATNVAEGNPPGTINDAIRALMADIASDAMRLSGTQTITGTKTVDANWKLSGSSARVLDLTYTGTTAGSSLGSLRFYGTGSGVTGSADVVGELATGSITSGILRLTAGASNEIMRLSYPSSVPTVFIGKTAADTTNAGIWAYRPTGTGGSYGRINIVKGTSDANSDSVANYYNGTYIGGITNTTTSTSFATSSDKRLKQNITAAPSSGSVIDGIGIVSYDWKLDGSHVRYGVVAQDLYGIYPEAVSAGDSGSTIQKTWAVDYSKLVPLLVKEVQSLRGRVAALEAN